MFLKSLLLFAILQTSLTLPTTIPPPSQAEGSGFGEELFKLLPVREIQAVKANHLKTDPEFQASVKYFKSPEWISMIEEVRKTPEWIEYKNFMKEAGFDLDYLIKHLEHCVNATDTKDFKVEGVKPSLSKFFEDVKITQGMQIMKGMNDYLEKVGKTEEHKKSMEKLASGESKEKLEKVLQQPSLKKVVGKLMEMGVNVDYLVHLVYTLSGWQSEV